MKLDKKIEEKQAQLNKLGEELAQLKQALSDKQIEAIKLDGAITQLKELNESSS